MIKKMMLLAMAVGALVAFAAPSMASAEEWATNGTPLGGTTNTGDPIHFTGTLSSTKGAAKISCNATANATLWNAGGKGTGEATLTLSEDPVGTGGCTVAVNFGGGYVDITNCHVEPRANGVNWTVTTKGETEVDIDNVSFTNTFRGTGCINIGIPSGTEITDTGVAEGAFEINEEGEACLAFSNGGTFAGGSKIDGSVCTAGALEL